jgi:poly-gamma-glutamate synthesis protein (capsule biosynthesis protein)
MRKTNDDLILYGVGDIGPDRSDPGSIFKNVSSLLGKGDLVFCQLEINLSTRGSGPQGQEIARNPGIAAAMKKAGFNIVSFAGNHCLEAGIDSFRDTIKNLKDQQFSVIGVGENIGEARTPAIIERNGTRIAFLGYSSVSHLEQYAGENRPGSNPLRARTFYESIEPSQPGAPGRIYSYPYKEDFTAMKEDIRKAKKQADVVIASMHCGVHMTPVVVADYQKEYAHAAIDAGADLVLQHHAHILKGIEVYGGKVIFYGLGNFALEIHFMTKAWAQIPAVKQLRGILNPDWNPPYPDYPSFPFPPDSRKTIIAKCAISNKAVSTVSYLPAYINPTGEPEVLNSKDKRFTIVTDYMKEISSAAGFSTRFETNGDEIVIIK